MPSGGSGKGVEEGRRSREAEQATLQISHDHGFRRFSSRARWEGAWMAWETKTRNRIAIVG